VRLIPQRLGDLEWINVGLDRVPPLGLVASAMDLPMMGPAQRNAELIADLATHGLGLCMAQMMRVGRPPVAQ
jgi:hypothetical protein